MSDPAIKLFGKTIQLPESETLTNGEVVMQVSEFDDQPSSSSWSSEADSKGNKRERESDANNNKCEEKSINKEENRTNSTKTPSADNESATTKASKSEEQQSEQEKTLKKPDKILPCPRCNSMDTKFCYYNNYNVNQPRHFCKNCQRYWTAGGTMRNVPVGAGRRKNKTSSSQLRQLSISETLPSDLKLKQTVLTFGSNAPLCESMASVLKTADKSMNKPEELPINDDNTNNGFSTHVPCFPGAPWPNPYPYPYPWSPQMGPTFCPPAGYPMPFYPAAPYWGCAIPAPGPWNMQWVPAPPNYHPAPPGTTSRTNNGEEETETTKEEEPEKSLWAPKTLRIDDPDEAAKSSIWATLGIKNEGVVGGNGGGGMFKAFRSKGEDKEAIKEASPALQANPAALSRSLNFQERS